jgi:predicted NAD/FAD-dependent oxidoreductase
MTSVAVIGAGLSGLVVARRLQAVADVVVFEKSRGPGGRMATRYAGDYAFDHGAQFFTARSAGFRAFLQPLLAAGSVKAWPARFAELDRGTITSERVWGGDYPHYVGAPGMNQVGKSLAEGLDVRLESTVARIERRDGSWQLSDAAKTGLGRFDWVVLAMPAAQTAALAQGFDDLAALAAERNMLGCFALMLGLQRPLDLPWDAALVRNADISWVSVNSSKPDRGKQQTLVVHSTNAWANAHLDDEIDEVRAYLVEQASLVVGTDLCDADHCRVHRWRYANIGKQSGPAFYLDKESQLAACGDWFRRGRIEAAYTSGVKLAAALGERLGAPVGS